MLVHSQMWLNWLQGYQSIFSFPWSQREALLLITVAWNVWKWHGQKMIRWSETALALEFVGENVFTLKENERENFFSTNSYDSLMNCLFLSYAKFLKPNNIEFKAKKSVGFFLLILVLNCHQTKMQVKNVCSLE